MGCRGISLPVFVSAESKGLMGMGFVSAVDKGVRVVCFETDWGKFVSDESKGLAGMLLVSAGYKQVSDGRQVGRGEFV